MDKKAQLKPLAAALGTTFVVSLAAAPLANAADNPFSAVEYHSGYMVAGDDSAGSADESKSTEGKCGGAQTTEGTPDADKSTEGKCGESQMKSTEGSCGGAN